MNARETSLPGCFFLEATPCRDARGTFTKTFQQSAFSRLGLETVFREQYYTRSLHGVLRGLHFQVPPLDHAKLVYCVEGEVVDAVVDLRAGSPAFGRHELFTLGPEMGGALYIPSGLAHGFYVTGPSATMVYTVTSEHSPAHDAGIRWDSAGIPWPLDGPAVLSERDRGFPTLAAFQSPFTFPSPGRK